MYSADVDITDGKKWIRLCVSFDAPTLTALKSAAKRYVKEIYPEYKGKIKITDVWEFVEKQHEDIIL